jgi:NADH-quinone oxidoreductase subunit L
VVKLIVFLPLLAAIVAGLGNRMLGNFAAKLITTGALFVSFALSWPIFLQYLAGTAPDHQIFEVLDWIRSDPLNVSWSLRVDALTAVMLVVVTTVSAFVHLYSWGYMADDPDQPRFFTYLSLFTFAMLMLVTADNLVQMFFGWEGVGLASYLLIGFWYHKPSANAAAIKAFVVNRVGDFGFSLGIFGTFLVFGTISIPQILEAAPAYAGSTIGFLGMRVEVMTLLCILLFIGAMGKSAQIGLHTWLPDAMEGPTPVSALIHAATMVTAGVFMVCRLSPMFVTSEVAMHVVMYFGAATALFAATVGVVQNDIKRVIAYSTCSQLGYMFFGAGVGAFGASMFHLFTHAFFKALLFLGAGSVIHAMHHEQDMRFYGGLRKHIPVTFWAMTVGTLALTGFWYTAGFFSKDAILEASYAAGGPGRIAFAVGAFAAALTSFYSWRLAFLTFFGEPRWAGSEHIQHAVHAAHGHHGDHSHDETPDLAEVAGSDPHHANPAHAPATGTGGYHPHESPLTILIPLIVLSIGALFAGLVFHGAFLGAETGGGFWRGSLSFDEHLMRAMEEVPVWVTQTPAVAMLLGFVVAWWGYIRDTSLPARAAASAKGIYAFLLNKWYFDELYDFLFVRPAFALGRLLWQKGDEGTIDRFGPDGVAAFVANTGSAARRLQSGYVYTYALVMLLGLAGAATWAMAR